jgi:hypothetical protein
LVSTSTFKDKAPFKVSSLSTPDGSCSDCEVPGSTPQITAASDPGP